MCLQRQLQSFSFTPLKTKQAEDVYHQSDLISTTVIVTTRLLLKNRQAALCGLDGIHDECKVDKLNQNTMTVFGVVTCNLF